MKTFKFKDWKNFVIMYVIWIVAHFIAPHAYAYGCTSPTVWGLLWSPFMASAPQCVGLRWVISTGGSNLTSIWTAAGIWIAAQIAV